MVEILESRHISQVLDGMSRIFGKMRALWVPILRIHSDCEKTFRAPKEWTIEKRKCPGQKPGGGK